MNRWSSEILCLHFRRLVLTLSPLSIADSCCNFKLFLQKVTKVLVRMLWNITFKNKDNIRVIRKATLVSKLYLCTLLNLLVSRILFDLPKALQNWPTLRTCSLENRSKVNLVCGGFLTHYYTILLTFGSACQMK